MKNHWLKALLLSLVLVLAACGNSEETTEAGTTQGPATTEATEAPEATDVTETAEETEATEKTEDPFEGITRLPLQIDLDEAYEMSQTDDTIVLIDLRSADAYWEASVPGAQTVPFEELEDGIGEFAEDMLTPIVVFDEDGESAPAAFLQLREMGYRNVSVGSGISGYEGELE